MRTSLSLAAGAAADDFEQDALDGDPARVEFAGRVVFGFDRRKGDFVALAGIDFEGALASVDERGHDVAGIAMRRAARKESIICHSSMVICHLSAVSLSPVRF